MLIFSYQTQIDLKVQLQGEEIARKSSLRSHSFELNNSQRILLQKQQQNKNENEKSRDSTKMIQRFFKFQDYSQVRSNLLKSPTLIKSTFIGSESENGNEIEMTEKQNIKEQETNEVV